MDRGSSTRAAPPSRAALRRERVEPLLARLGWALTSAGDSAQARRSVAATLPCEPGAEGREGAGRVDLVLRADDGQALLMVHALAPGLTPRAEAALTTALRRAGWSLGLALVLVVAAERLALFTCVDPAQPHDPAPELDVARAALGGRWDALARLISRDAVNQGSLDAYLTPPRASLTAAQALRADLEGAQAPGALARALDGGLFERMRAARDGAPSPAGAGWVDDARHDLAALPAERLGALHEGALAGEGERRAGGVYYTPAYVARHAVRGALDRLLAGKTPAQVEALAVLDPACGAGAFLLAAYERLLDWYLAWYLDDGPERHAAAPEPRLFLYDGAWHLTRGERARVLRRHLFGVDLDARAVALTRQALWLKLLDGPRGVDAPPTPLPSLSQTVCQGDALAGPASGGGRDARSQTPGEGDAAAAWERFVWSARFGAVRARGGFDLVIGNPPYLKEPDNAAAFASLRHGHLARYYRGKMDLWYAFACQAIELTRAGGLHSFLVTSSWVQAAGAAPLRRKLEAEAQVLDVVDFVDRPIFADAAIQTMIYTLRKGRAPAGARATCLRVTRSELSDRALARLLAWHRARSAEDAGGAAPQEGSASQGDAPPGGERFAAQARFGSGPGRALTLASDRTARALERIARGAGLRLEASWLTQGIVPNPEAVGRRNRQRLPPGAGVEVGAGVFVLDEAAVAAGGFSRDERALWVPYHTGVERYRLPASRARLLYLTRHDGREIEALPGVRAHLERFRPIMEARRETRLGRVPWYALHWPREEGFFTRPSIVSVRKTARPCFCYSPGGRYFSLATNLIQPPVSAGVDLMGLLAVLNSRVIAFWLAQRGKRQGGRLQVDTAPLRELPLVAPRDGRGARELAALAVQRSALAARDGGARDDAAVRALEREIDARVFDLYGLDAETRALIMQATDAPGA